ncbi:MAG: DNA-directed RNA polymerase subunit H [Candidatus Marsarchaeota archaeon]|nr:DNA-directed RNA polymerase subunit H [Candidatus Marsarchaeota archaeon]MCL5111512.1 DNA-directed RNA polymerase subunit H [Candidatus Marsarchaeota archaeon]
MNCLAHCSRGRTSYRLGEPLVKPPLRLVAKHEIISDSEAKKTSKKFTTPLDKFPKMLSTDPQAVKIGAKPGQLVAIHRSDPTGDYVYYRYVVERI